MNKKLLGMVLSLFLCGGLMVRAMLDEVELSNQMSGVQEVNEIADQLNSLLANEYVLYTKTWKFHWNIRGQHFGSLHEFFGKQREQLADIVDDVAERVRALNVMSDGTLSEFMEKTFLSENPQENPKDFVMIEILLKDHERIIEQIREMSVFANDNGDYGTNNFLCDLLMKHEKMAWMLRSFLQ